MTDYQKLFDMYVREIEDCLPGFLPDPACPQGSVAKAMAYSLTNGGKRIRAVLLLAFYELYGGKNRRDVLPFAAAIEMIHAYSLIHDDLPCMDDDDMRRGKPSCHIAFGEDIALLAGDALLTLAFELCTVPACVHAFGAEKVLTATNALARAAGWAGMVGGQVIDLESEGKSISLDTLRGMDEKKTGALIAVSAEIGCILAGADAAATGHAGACGATLGIAFQIVDDILDVTGDAALLGKPVGSDRENFKSTYTAHYGIDGARDVALQLSSQVKSALYQTNLDAGFLIWLTDKLLAREF